MLLYYVNIKYYIFKFYQINKMKSIVLFLIILPTSLSLMKNNHKTKIKVGYNEFKTLSNSSYFFNIYSPISKCNNEQCDYCCLDNNHCGTKIQCENTKSSLFIVNTFFIMLCTILLFALIIKCIQNDSYPDQTQGEKLPNKELNELIGVFNILNKQKDKIIYNNN